MAKPLLPDELWERIEPLLPPPKPRRFRFPGRKPLDNRKALTGILFVLKTGIPWEYLPLEMGCGSGMTCWRRLRDWQAAGVWQQLHEILLAELNAAFSSFGLAPSTRTPATPAASLLGTPPLAQTLLPACTGASPPPRRAAPVPDTSTPFPATATRRPITGRHLERLDVKGVCAARDRVSLRSDRGLRRVRRPSLCDASRPGDLARRLPASRIGRIAITRRF